MGSPKALLEWGGKSFLQHVLDAHRAAGLEPLVVLGHHAEKIRQTVDLGQARCFINPDPDRGQISSLQTALEEVRESSAVLVHPVDHPAVRAETLLSLLRFHRRVPACIALPCRQGKKGHPVLFPSRFYPDLLAGPAEGAREVVRRHPQSVFLLPVDDAGILADIDTPEDREKLGDPPEFLKLV